MTNHREVLPITQGLGRSHEHGRLPCRRRCYPGHLMSCLLVLMGLAAWAPAVAPAADRRPNILLIMTDDQSWEHVGAYGDPAVSTPNIDRLADEGVRFSNAHAASPSCTPSRGAVVTGQHIYRLQEGGVLWGFIRKEYPVFPLLLEDAGYVVGNTGKGYAPTPPPSETPDAHWLPLGTPYNDQKLVAPAGISSNDYSANFHEFLRDVPAGEPFFFWLGIVEPHVPHPAGEGAGRIDVSRIRVPAYLPDVPQVRNALADYLFEIEWADEMVGKVLRSLEQRGDLDDTIVIFTSDNGMPFPRSKATLYDAGTRVPLLIKWGKRMTRRGIVDEPVSLTDLAPTLLELAGVDVPRQMTGQSLNPLLFEDRRRPDHHRSDFVVSAIEKHVGNTRPGNLGFPRRAIHTSEWTYIRNYEPDRWPAGDPDLEVPNWGFFGDIDPTPAKAFMQDNRRSPEVESYFELGFGKVPEEELYDRIADPDMIHNLAGDPIYAKQAEQLRGKMDSYLMETGDPRMRGEAPWDSIDLDR